MFAIPDFFRAYNLGNGSTVPLDSLIGLINSNNLPQKRPWKEAKDAVYFGYLLQLWKNKKIDITMINEEKTQYKGIDFFLRLSDIPNKHVAFQLFEYNPKESTNISSDVFANWIIDRKQYKNGNKIHLVVSVKNATVCCNYDILTKMLHSMSFESITLFGQAKESHYLLGISKLTFLFSADNTSTPKLTFDNPCPFFQ